MVMRVKKRRSIQASSRPSSSSGVSLSSAPIVAGRAHNVVDALFKHFQKWQPEVLEKGAENYACKIQEVRQPCEGPREK